MKIELSDEEIEIIRVSLEYSKRAIEESKEQQYELKRKKLEKLDLVRRKFFKSNSV